MPSNESSWVEDAKAENLSLGTREACGGCGGSSVISERGIACCFVFDSV